MYLSFIYIFIISAVSCFDLPRNNSCSNAIQIDGDHYGKAETIPIENAYPSDAHYDVYGNLFYVKTAKKPDGYYFDIYVVKLNTTEPVRVEGLPKGKGYSVAVDKKEAKIYFGTEHGIYKYNYETHTASPDGTISEKVNMVFVDQDSNKYITKTNDGVDELYLLENSTQIPVTKIDVLNDMGIDERNDMYFIKENDLFVLKNEDARVQLIVHLDYSGTGQIAFNEKGTVFIATDKLRYFKPNQADKMDEVTIGSGQITALAFKDDGDFCLGLNGQLIKYKKLNNCYARY